MHTQKWVLFSAQVLISQQLPILWMLSGKQSCPQAAHFTSKGIYELYTCTCCRERLSKAGIPHLPSTRLSLLDPRETYRPGLGWLQSPFDAYNSIFQSLSRTACETKEETTKALLGAFLLTANCRTLFYRPCLFDIWHMLPCGCLPVKLFWFVLFLSCLHMVCVYVYFANLLWQILNRQTALDYAVFGILFLIGTL